jgi:hypothetical protein
LRRRILFSLLALLAAPVRAEADRAQLIDHLSLVAAGALPDPALRAETLAQPSTPTTPSTPSTIERYIDRLLAAPAFAANVAGSLLLPSLSGRHVQYDHYTLKQEGGVFYLRQPCAPARAEAVHPWWDLRSTVRVCPDSYLPTHLRHPAGWYCGGGPEIGLPDFCGCGPNLVFCVRDAAQLADVRKSARDEVLKTLSAFVDRDLPIDRAFTSNETFHDRNVEMLYARGRIAVGELTALPLDYFTGEPRLAPRHESYPGQHAGVLTTPHVVWSNDAARMRQAAYYEYLFCEQPDSVNVKASQALGLGVTNVRDGEGWQQLAAMPVCTNCHARLDYGMQFFRGYVATRVANYFLPPPHPATALGRYYVRDIGDLRGEAPLTPLGFAEMSVKQEEFSSCMVDRVLGHVLNDQAEPADREAVERAFAAKHSLRAAFRAAMIRYVALFERPPVRPTPAMRSVATSSPGEVVVSRALRTLIDEHCIDCHRRPERDLRPSSLRRDLVERMLDRVAFGKMPKRPEVLAPADRSTMVRLLISSLYPDRAAQMEAFRYFGGGMHALPVHDLRALSDTVRASAGAGRGDPKLEEFLELYAPGDEREYGPGVAAFVALNALRACKANGAAAEALTRCVEKAVVNRALVSTPLR